MSEAELDRLRRAVKRLMNGQQEALEAIAQAFEESRTKRELAEAERKREKTELERLEALAAPVEELSQAAEILVRAHLIAAGYHRHKGE